MATKITQIKNKSNDNRLPAFFVYSLKSAIFAVGYELNKKKKQHVLEARAVLKKAKML